MANKKDKEIRTQPLAILYLFLIHYWSMAYDKIEEIYAVAIDLA